MRWVIGIVVMGLGAMTTGTSFGNPRQACTATIALGATGEYNFGPTPHVKLPHREGLFRIDGGQPIVVIRSSPAHRGESPTEATVKVVKAGSYLLSPLMPVDLATVGPEQIDWDQVMSTPQEGEVLLPAGHYLYQLTYIEGSPRPEPDEDVTLCTVYSPVFRVPRDIPGIAGGRVSRNACVDQPTCAVNAPVLAAQRLRGKCRATRPAG